MRLPQQQRSRERVGRILDAADAIVSANGPAGLRVADVATAASVPVGTLYQFFPSKQDILDALALRYALGFEEVLDAELRNTPAKSWTELFNRLFLRNAEYYARNPGLRRLWLAHDEAYEARDRDSANPRLVKKLVKVVQPLVDNEAAELELILLCVWEAGQTLIQLAFRTDDSGNAAILDQSRAMLLGYLNTTLKPRPARNQHAP